MDQLIDRETAGLSADIPAALARYASSQPDSPAIRAPGRADLTFAGLYGQMCYVRDRLSGWGIDRGDPVVIVLPKSPELAAAIAVLPAGATAVPCRPDLSVDEYASLLRRCSARAVIVTRGARHAARRAAERAGVLQIDLVIEPDAAAGAFRLNAAGSLGNSPDGNRLAPDIAYILSTSGTTSRRKLIPYPHGCLVSYADAAKAWFRFEPSDSSVHIVPMYFAHGIMSALMVPLLCGTSVVCAPSYDAESFFALLEAYRPTWFTAGFTVHRDILRHVDDHPEIVADTQLRFMKSGSGRLDPDEIMRLEQAFGAPFIVGLSSTETGRITFNPIPPGRRKIDSVGVPVANEVRVIDDGGRPVATGQEGEIVVRGPLVFRGYLDDPAEDERAFAEGWYRTGDLGKFDADGYLFLTGRAKDVINQGGEKISPTEIDGHLEACAGVAEAAAFGMPHRTLGEIVVAAVVLEAGADTGEQPIREQLRSKLAAAKVPRKIFFLDHLPRAENGKLQRYRLPEAVR